MMNPNSLKLSDVMLFFAVALTLCGCESWKNRGLDQAVVSGDVKEANRLLADGADVNAKVYTFGATPLNTAAFHGHKDIVELLIDKGADVNAKDNDGDTPLYVSAYRGQKDIVELLIAKGADVNAKDKDDFTPLHAAAHQGHRDVAELLIAKGADVNAKDKNGDTPLTNAIHEGNESVADERDAQAKTFSVRPDKANIYVYRNKNMGAAVKMDVFLDGKPVGQTVAHSYLVLEIAPGKHTLISKAENDSVLDVDAESGKNYFIWQEVKMGILHARNKLQIVDEGTGKAGVADCKLIETAK